MGAAQSDSGQQATRDECQRLIDFLTKGKGKGEAYRRLGEFVDTFGSRVAGSQRLEAAIDHLEAELSDSGLSVHTEEFKIDGWRRGHEEAELLQPFAKRLPLLGLGGSVPTPKEGVEADCLVVESFDELERVKDSVPGKIVVFNQPYVHYGVSVKYRTEGASRAGRLGAAAALVRSVTPLSVGSPHTGYQTYAEGVRQIPAACVTVEDAEMLCRMQRRGQRARLRLRMDSGPCEPFTSRNIVADLVGSEKPEEVVVVCGHVDSWDVGQGAMDDAGGVFAAMEAVRALQALGCRPARTVRLVVFSGEEFGVYGGRDYYRRHRRELADRASFFLESDSGTFAPFGLAYKGSEAAGAELKKVLELLKPIGDLQLLPGLTGPDVEQWPEAGVPAGELMTARSGQSPEFYFYFHHTEGDMLTVQEPGEMDACAAVFAVVSLALANADGLLPRGGGGREPADWVLLEPADAE